MRPKMTPTKDAQSERTPVTNENDTSDTVAANPETVEVKAATVSREDGLAWAADNDAPEVQEAHDGRRPLPRSLQTLLASVALVGLVLAAFILGRNGMAPLRAPSAASASSRPSHTSSALSGSGPVTTVVKSMPFNASGLLAGTANPNLPDGESGKVSVIHIGPLVEAGSSATLPFAFRNNTSNGVSHVDWTGTARSGGSIVATGRSQGTIPAQVQPGEIGLAFIYFGNGSKLSPADAEYEFTANTMAADQTPYNTAPLKVTEANTSGGAIVGAAVNSTGKSVAGPYSVSVYCFEGDKLLRQHGTFAEQQGPVAAGGQVTFSANLYGATCPTFAVGVNGWFA
jgi:hypothetical protein